MKKMGDFVGHREMDIYFDLPLQAVPASGLPATLSSVDQTLVAISTMLAAGVSSAVHWRFASTMLKLASTGIVKDISFVRQSVSDALEADGWLSPAPEQSPAPSCFRSAD